MAVKERTNLILIDGHPIPPPSRDFEVVSIINVDSGRNVKGQVVGQVVGRRQWKLNNLQWNGIDANEWAYLKSLLEPFFVNVTFTGDDGVRRTIKMYPGDTTGKPYWVSGLSYKMFESAKFNLIDCGY